MFYAMFYYRFLNYYVPIFKFFTLAQPGVLKRKFKNIRVVSSSIGIGILLYGLVELEIIVDLRAKVVISLIIGVIGLAYLFERLTTDNKMAWFTSIKYPVFTFHFSN